MKGLLKKKLEVVGVGNDNPRTLVEDPAGVGEGFSNEEQSQCEESKRSHVDG